MSESRQATVSESADSGPTTGVKIDERTHYAHARYAAAEHPGTIWFDPRDGREILTLDVDTSAEALDLGERVLTGIRLHGHRYMCGIVDPSQKWVLRMSHSEKIEVPAVGDTDEMLEQVRSMVQTEVFESQAAARKAAADRVPEYDDAEWRDAVEFRVGDDGE